MTNKLNKKIETEIAEFTSRVSAGEKPEAVLTNILRRIHKEQDRDTRHACAEGVLQSNGKDNAHSICMNTNTFD